MTLEEAISSGLFALYLGITKQLKLSDEALRWMIKGASQKQRRNMEGNRPTLIGATREKYKKSKWSGLKRVGQIGKLQAQSRKPGWGINATCHEVSVHNNRYVPEGYIYYDSASNTGLRMSF